MRANDLTALAARLDAAAAGSGICLTITFPTHRHSPDNAKDPVALRNLVAEAKQALEAHGLDRSDRMATIERLDGLEALVAEEIDWNHTNLGIAAYVTPATAEVVSLGHRPPERVVAGVDFHLASLIADVSSADDLDVIVLSTGGGDTDGARAFHLEAGVPVPVGQPMSFDIRDRAATVQRRSTAHERRLTEDFLRRFDDEVTEHFGADHDRRIVLCGTRRLRDMWREVARPVHVDAVIADVDGNHDRMSDHELATVVVEAAEEAEDRRLAERVADIEAIPTARLAMSNDDILTAAREGRVAEVVVEEGAVEEVSVGGVVIEDRVSAIIRAAWDTSATVTVVPPGALARYDGVVGVLRYTS